MTLRAAEKERIRGCLLRLLPHLDRDDVTLTGGLAIELLLNARGASTGREKMSDLDFVARRLGAVAPSVTRDFLVCHYHRSEPCRGKFLVMLADPASRLRVDVFPDLASSVDSARLDRVCGEELLVLDPESILDHKLRTLAKASETSRVDRKHHADAEALARLLGRAAPPRVTSVLGQDAYSTDLEASCPRCAASGEPGFALAPRREIFDVLGYV